MKTVLKRSLSIVLVFAMALSASMVSASDVYAEELSEEITEDGAKADLTGQNDAIEESSVQSNSEETKGLEDDTDETDDSEKKELSELTVAEYTLTLEYDDYYSLSDFEEADLTDYHIIGIENSNITSTKVSNGTDTGEPDTDVLVYDEEKKKLIATGIGTAIVTLSNIDDENEDDESGDIVSITATVIPATLTMMFIAGQSNAEGYTSASSYQDSVLCEEGTVYSTYAPSSSSVAQKSTGINGLTECTSDNADNFVAGSLTGTMSLAGSELVYPLNALTESGNGKTGMDSGLAYQWHAETDDKVWVINAAYSATSISNWTVSGECYKRAKAVYQDAVKTAKAEIDAGHYKNGNRVLFWLQGEDDASKSAGEYMSDFRNMYQGFDNEGLGIEDYGIIMVRASTGSYTTQADLHMTGPRTAQYLLGNNAGDSKVYVVSNANEQWVSDTGVQSYFQQVYGNSFNYSTHSGKTGLPATVSEVHPDIHYTQIGHNENGITASENMLRVVNGSGGTPQNVYWYNTDGTALETGTSIQITEKEENVFVPVADPVCSSKGIQIETDSSVFQYDENEGILNVISSGDGTLTARIGDVSSSIIVTVLDSTELNTPALKTATASNGGIEITWSSIEGAAGYRIFRKPSGGSWLAIGETTSTSYTDTSALNIGTTYYYTVRAYRGSLSSAEAHIYDSAYWSDFESPGLSVNAVGATATPALKSASASSGSIKVTWNSVSGASGYRVYRKPSGGSWTGIGTTTSTSYTDTDKLSIGTTYYYTVRAYKGDEEEALANVHYSNYWSDFESPGVSAKAVGATSTPSLKSASASSGSIKVTWNSVSGASGYRVYRKPSGGSWTGIGTTTSTSYTDSDKLSIGTTYYYTVRAYAGDEKTALANVHYAYYWSDFESAGVSAKAVGATSTPSLKSATVSSGNINVSWDSVSGASGYRVYKKTSGGSWSAIGTTTATSYTDTDKLNSGTTYYYTVRAYVGDEKTALANVHYASYWSDFESTGVSVKATGATETPSLKKATVSEGSIVVTWNSVSGASGYRVYRKPSGGSWTGIGTTTGTSYTDTGQLSIGTTYYYTVRAYKGDEETALANVHYANYWSDFESPGVSAKAEGALATPSLKQATSSKGTVTVTWGSISGAGGYRVFRKPSGGSWLAISDTTSTSYTDESSDLQAGTTYYYTVRAYKGDIETANANIYYSHWWSDFVSGGISVKAKSVLDTPSLSKATAGTAKITVTWNSVSGAGGYLVFRKTSSSSWTQIGNTGSTSYTDLTNLDAGETYYYTVRAHVGDYDTAKKNIFSANCWSDFESPGVSATAISVLNTPTLKSATKTSSGVSVTYGSVSGASGYCIYRKASGGSWSEIGYTDSTSYTDTGSLSSGTTYYYTVRAYVGSYSTAKSHIFDVNYWSAFDTAGLKYATVADTDMYNKAQSYSSSTKYLILVNSSTNKVGIFTGSKNNWDMKYYWSCSTGKSSTPTKKGTFTIGSKGKSFSGSSYTCWYYSQFSGNYLFHSVLYKKGSMSTISDGRLGMNISHGCVRLDIDNAKWIYDNVPKGSTVVSY